MVHVSGKMKSNHTTKQAAKNAARRYASDGDELIIHRSNGTIQKRVTVRDASPDDDDKNTPFAFPMGPTDYGEGTMDSAFPW
jgi:hypothetical protein